MDVGRCPAQMWGFMWGNEENMRDKQKALPAKQIDACFAGRAEKFGAGALFAAKSSAGLPPD